MKIDFAIVCAMSSEFEAVCGALEDIIGVKLPGDRRAVLGTHGRKRVGVVHAGIGKVNAASAAECALAVWKARMLVTCGLCGGLRGTMDVFDVYAVKDAVEYDFDLSEVDRVPVGKLDEFDTRHLRFTVPAGFAAETLATGDHFRNGDGDYPLIVDELGAGLRDMEGAAVAHVALKHGVPVAGLKCVTNVRGKGAMTEQYAENRDRANRRLTEALPAFLKAFSGDRTRND